MSPESRRGDHTRLQDIVEAATAIGEHLDAGTAATAPERIVMDAIKYNLVAIGEAANHVSEELQEEYPDIDWVAIRGLRNILTHEYFRVNLELIRRIAETNVPELLKKVEDILSAR